MFQRCITSVLLVGGLLLANMAGALPDNRRSLSTWGGMKASLARSTETDVCSSRNIAENIRAFYKCLQSKLSNM